MTMQDSSAISSPSSVKTEEISRFEELASQWWDPYGPMRPLHAMNELRIGWTQTRIERFCPGRAGIRILDIGCGAGLASEALAKKGHQVLGLDASEKLVEVARHHQRSHPAGLPAGALSYRAGSAEDLCREGARFDVVTAFEVIEHVTDPAAFMKLLAQLTQPGGLVILSTMNRTLRSLAVAKIGAEYIARLLPVGTHSWRQFITPAELDSYATPAGLRIRDSAGMSFAPTGWYESRSLAINYIAALTQG